MNKNTMIRTIESPIIKYKNSFRVAKPNGMGPINPPKPYSILPFDFNVNNINPVITTTNPIKMIKIPIGTSCSIFTHFKF